MAGVSVFVSFRRVPGLGVDCSKDMEVDLGAGICWRLRGSDVGVSTVIDAGFGFDLSILAST